MSYQKKLGLFGQEYAKKFLIKQGFCVIAENFCIRGGELDGFDKKPRNCLC